MGALWEKDDPRFYSIEIGTPEDDVLLHPPSGVDAGPWVYEDLDDAREVCRLHNAPIKRAIRAEAALAEERGEVTRLRALLSPLAEIAKLVEAERERITRGSLVAEGFTVEGALAEWIETTVFGAAYQLFGEEAELLAWFRDALAATTPEGGETP